MTNLPTKDIDDVVFDILKRSKSLDVFPTPVDKIVEYCELRLTDDNFLHKIPRNYVAKNIDALQRALKKILGAIDQEQKTIFIDPTLPSIKKGFVKLHEVGHGALPWQKDINYSDNEDTLTPEVKIQFEAETNHFASSSLFQLSRFEDEMNKLPLEIGSAMALAKKFGGSNHAAMRRYAEISRKRCALIVLEKENSRNRILSLRNSFQSDMFTKEFGDLTWPEIFDNSFPFIREYNRGQKLHKDGEITLHTVTGFVSFEYHYFNNGYNVFILLLPPGEKNKSNTKIYVSSNYA